MLNTKMISEHAVVETFEMLPRLGGSWTLRLLTWVINNQNAEHDWRQDGLNSGLWVG